ncbi:MAG: DUF4833 domain-containing protein [Cognatishimia sp.]|uniref:DUF4833 domain-containing protein n=1 Tax=Cognatishimia sp. TaxID=2211648 RepID=UPI003B8C2893
MKRYKLIGAETALVKLKVALLFVMLGVACASPGFGQSLCAPLYPAPKDKGAVFFIQHSGNSNTIVYVANQLADGRIDPDDPVEGYWRYLSGSGRKGPLRFWESQIAYGVNVKPLTGQPGKFTANLNAAPNIEVRLEPTPTGQVRAVMPIAGREARLVCIFVEWREGIGGIPDVIHVDFHGLTLVGAQHIIQRLRR